MRIADQVKALLRDIVWAQDRGVPVGEQLQDAFIGQSLINTLCVEADIERSRMAREGLDVLMRKGDKAFILGLDDMQYKGSPDKPSTK